MLALVLPPDHGRMFQSTRGALIMNLNDSGQFPIPVLPGGVLASSKCSHVLSAACAAYKVAPEGEAFVKAPPFTEARKSPE